MSSCHRCGESTTNAHGFCRNCVDPAPKEERMNRSDYRIGVNGSCPKCGRFLTTTYCPNCTIARINHGFTPRPEEAAERRAAALREVYARAFDAALASGLGLSSADYIALESVRTHAARMAELERVIAEGAAP